jgi:hypothetical protein
MRAREFSGGIWGRIWAWALATPDSVCYNNQVSKEASSFSRAASATRLDVGDKVLGGLAESRNLQNKIFNEFERSGAFCALNY